MIDSSDRGMGIREIRMVLDQYSDLIRTGRDLIRDGMTATAFDYLNAASTLAALAGKLGLEMYAEDLRLMRVAAQEYREATTFSGVTA